ncbi:YbgC/FadM family acyl-CoA thioesterase [Hydrogenimonas sp.]
MKIRVYYEDTDAAGIVYYANYLKYCERARSELFFSRGLLPQSSEGYFVVKHLEADYKGSAKLGDLLEVKSRLVEKRAVSVVLEQTVALDSTMLFQMNIKLAYLHNGRPVRIPLEIYSLFQDG